MFRLDKSIGGPLEFTTSFSDQLEAQAAVPNDRKALQPQAVPGSNSPCGRRQQGIERLPRQFTSFGLQQKPAMDGPAQHSSRLARERLKVQSSVRLEGSQLIEPGL